MNSIFSQMMKGYENQAVDEKEKLREVMQKIALAGLYRGGFFEEAAFYGGTCLRLFHGLPRFSEDMDFSLLRQDPSFDLERYFPFIIEEFRALGLEINIRRKEKNINTAIESAFLKNDTSMYDIGIDSLQNIKIKLEVDTNPPSKFQTENKVLLLPFSFMVKCYEPPYLFAGKMHAFVFRGWKNRVKGRDWYDFEWYVRHNISLDVKHFEERVKVLSPKEPAATSPEEIKALIRGRIEKTDINQAKKDVLPFIEDATVLDIWSREYFLQLTDLIVFQN